MFRSIGMDVIADDDPPGIDDLRAFQEHGRAWVFTDHADRPVAYLLVDELDGHAHIEQVSVRPEYGRRGIGRSLIGAAEQWARQHDLAGLTLTTYAEVPWNAPYYQRLGFRILVESEVSDGVRSIREHEQVRGLDAWPRVPMRRPLGKETVSDAGR